MKLLIELDEEYVKVIDKIKFLVGGRTNRKLQLEIIKAIKNGKALEQEPRWIPISKQLPEESTAVLVWCPERKNIYCAYYEEKQWWIFGAYWEKITLDIIAWMPLPKAYRGGERMSKWIAEFELEDGDTMPEHMDLNYKGVKIDFHCKPLEQEPKSEWEQDHAVLKAYSDGANEVLDKLRAEIAKYGSITVSYAITKDTKTDKGIEKLVSDVLKEAKEQVLEIIDKYKEESEG